MKYSFLLVFSLFILSCNNQNKKSIAEQLKKDSLEQVRKNDSIKEKIISDSILKSNFNKWIDNSTIFPNRIIYINKNFTWEKQSLKLKPNELGLTVEISDDSRFENGHYVTFNIKRVNSVFDIKFSDAEMDLYDPTDTYFSLIVTDKNGKTSTISFYKRHANKSTDEDLLKTISDHINDKVHIEEFFAREDEGHFEGDKKPADKKVRSFVLSDINKNAIKDSYNLYLLLKGK